MNRTLRSTSLVFAGVVAGVSLAAQSPKEIAFDANADFLTLPSYGEVAGVATNSKGHVFVYARTGHAVATLGDERTFYHGGSRLFQFDQNGKFVKEIGQGVYSVNFAQQVRVDPQDNVWVVDEGTNMLIKFNPQGRVAMVLGRRPEPVAGATQTNAPPVLDKKYQFGRPTDVAWDAQGNIFVSDGYVNSRVVKYDKSGRFLGQYAGGPAGPADNQLNTPHSIASDAQGNIYVADRGNQRVVVLTNDLKLKTNYTNVGNPWAVCVSPGAHQYLYASNSNPDSNTPASSWDITGEIYKMELDGTIIGKFGKAGKGLGEFSTIHEIDCRNPNELYVSEISAWRAQKIILNAQKPSTAAGAK